MSAKDTASANSDATASPLPTATADAHLRRLAALEQEIDAFADEVKRLRAMCEEMTDAAHFDSMLLTTRQAKLEELFDALRRECRNRRAQLVDASRYHAFVRQIDDLSATLREKKLLADREDYGTDLEDCCALIEQFEQVVRELSAAGERVAAVQKAEEELLRGSHPNGASIRAKSGDLRQLWRDVNEAANEREQALLDGKNIHMFDQRADEMLNRLAEQEAYLVALDAEELTNCDAATVRAFVQKHDDFLHALYAVEKQVNEACREADRIIQLFPRTRDHLEVRRSELSEQLKDVQDGARAFSERLAQAQNNQAYFQEYRDLMNWTRHIHTLITGEILARDVTGCEALNARHAEYRAEIQAHEPQRAVFVDAGKRMIAAGNALAPEISRKIDDLSAAFRQLYDVWHRRQAVYDENLDVQQWLAGAESLDAWLSERQQYLVDDWRLADGVEAVDDLIRQFDDFLATLDAQAPHVDALRRLTKLEQSYAKMRESEQQQRRADRERQQQQEAAAAVNRRDTQQIKTLEKKKLLQEKRQERERRKTQEISILRRTPSQENGGDFLSASAAGTAMMSTSTTLPRARHRASVASVELLLQQQQQFNNSAPESNNRTVISVNANVQQQQQSNNKRTSIILDRPPSALIGSSTSASVTVAETAPAEEFVGGAELRRRPSSATSGGGGGGGTSTTTRTPGFTTRRSQSIKKMRQWDDLKSIDMHGYIDRKQELQGGGKKATFRSWKNYYTILCGQLLCFFKDEESFMENMAAAPPVYILNARCEVYADYVKRKHTFRLNSTDGAEYLFAAENGTKMIEWVEKINFHARLAPSNQLASFQTIGPGCDATSVYCGGAYPTATSSARNSMCLDALSGGASSYSATGKYATLDHPTTRPSRAATVAAAPAPLVPLPSALQNGSGASTRSATFSQFSAVDALPRASSRDEEIYNKSQSQAPAIYVEHDGRSSLSGGAQFSPLNNSGGSAADPTADFVNWVETNNGRASTLPSAHHHARGGSGDDADSLNSAATAGGTSTKKRSVISLFKRSSKRT